MSLGVCHLVCRLVCVRRPLSIVPHLVTRTHSCNDGTLIQIWAHHKNLMSSLAWRQTDAKAKNGSLRLSAKGDGG